jgi:hypothetical protein
VNNPTTATKVPNLQSHFYDMGVDTDTNSLPVQTSAVDKVVEATHSTNHPVVDDEKHEGVTD